MTEARAELDDLDALERAVALNPQSPAAYRELAAAQLALARPFEALASCDRAIALDAGSAEAYRIRGDVLVHLKFSQNALTVLDRALTLDPDLANAHRSRAIALLALNRVEEALASCERALALQSDFAEAHETAGTTALVGHRFGEALARYDAAIALDPSLASAHFNKALCLLQTGEFEQGFRAYEWRKKLRRPVAVRDYAEPLWSGEQSIAGKTLFIHWEQGLGDTIQFYRYAKLAAARGARVVLSAQDPLIDLLQAADRGIQIIGPTDKPASFDFHCPLMSLPLAFGTTPTTIPAERRYLFSDQGTRAAWASRLRPSARPKIGLVWSGGHRHANDHNRSIALERLVPLFSDDVDWVCLQKELIAKDVGLLRQLGRVAFYGDEVRDFTDTAALIDLTDLVITVDTSAAHLAGAMGKPVFILLPYTSDWRWLLDRDDSPWYASARLYRQQKPGDWTSVIEQVKTDVRAASARTTRR